MSSLVATLTCNFKNENRFLSKHNKRIIKMLSAFTSYKWIVAAVVAVQYSVECIHLILISTIIYIPNPIQCFQAHCMCVCVCLWVAIVKVINFAYNIEQKSAHIFMYNISVS